MSAFDLDGAPRWRAAGWTSHGHVVVGAQPLLILLLVALAADIAAHIGGRGVVGQDHPRQSIRLRPQGFIQTDAAINPGNSVERKVDPAPARLAIGFTSQYHIPPRRVPLGGTRGPLHPWILIREWSQHVTAAERLEILVHELGHFFGAAHSAGSDSVMRPELGDRQAHALAFRIGFDPLNTLAMNLLAAELRRGPFRGYQHVRSETWAALHQVYSTLADSLPDDPAAPRYIEFLERHRPEE